MSSQHAAGTDIRLFVQRINVLRVYKGPENLPVNCTTQQCSNALSSGHEFKLKNFSEL